MRQLRTAFHGDIDAILRTCLARLCLIAIVTAAGSCLAHGQTNVTIDPRPPVGGVASPPDAVIVYLARGAAGACGENCAEWIAAEGVVYWDSPLRIIAFLDRFGDRKRPVFIDVRGEATAATRIGKVVRERGFEVGVSQTIVDQCQGLGKADCVAL